jgi:Uma2 family endonuclease
MTLQAISSQEERLYTPEEYLGLEENAEFRSEYDDGRITPMTGSTTNHNRISLNASIALSIGLKGQNFEIFMADIKLWIPQSRKFRYPDVMVISGQSEYYKNRKTTVTNPQVIIEVLSDSTEEFDRGNKFNLYKSIPTFREYILIDQERISIDQFYKTGIKSWSITQYDEQDSEIELRSLDLKLQIADIYDKVEFEASNLE